jgi:hypothetical protein
MEQRRRMFSIFFRSTPRASAVVTSEYDAITNYPL